MVCAKLSQNQIKETAAEKKIQTATEKKQGIKNLIIRKESVSFTKMVKRRLHTAMMSCVDRRQSLKAKTTKLKRYRYFSKMAKKTIIRQPSGLSCAQSTSDDDFLDDIVSSDGNTTISSDISISSYEDSSIIDDLFNPVSEKTRPPKVISPSPVTSSPLIGLKKKRRSQRKIVATSNNSPSKDAKFLTISPPALLSKTSNCDTSPSLSSKEEKKNGRKKKSELLDSKKKNEDKIRKKCEIKKVRVNKDKLPSNNHSTKSRPDDWLGSDGKTKRRSWKKKIDIRG